MGELDTTNRYAVGVGDGQLRILNPACVSRALTVEDAINLAAYLIVLASTLSPDALPDFNALVDAIHKT